MCVPGGESAHTDGSAVRVCVRVHAPLGCVGWEAEETVQDAASRTRLPPPHASCLQGQAPLHGNREGM